MDEEVLGDRFYIAQNYIPMDLYEGMDGFYQSFFIIEKRRTVKKKKFNEKGELIMVEEVDGGADRNTNKIEKTNPSDSAVIHKNNPYNIFKPDPNNPTNNEANNPANNEELSDSEWAKELDERIARLDELIKMIMESKGTQKVDNKVLQDALRKLKSEEAALKNKGMINQPFANTMDPNKPYHLIAGSFANLSNAERFVKDLKAKGFANAVVIGVFNNLYLVRIVDYPTRGDAVKAQNTYAKTFPGAWVHKWP
jgi:cell division protein FtsN